MNATTDDQGNLHLPARTISAPRLVSEEARQGLLAPGFTSNDWPQAKDDIETWKAYIDEADAQFVQYLAPLKEMFPAEIEEHALDSGATLYEITPETIAPRNKNCAIFYVHGGCYVLGGGELAATMALTMAGIGQYKTFSIDYRMPPDHPYPAGLDDTVEAYRMVIERYKPGNIAFGGVSAGGGLSASALLKIRDIGLPLPGAAFIDTPMADFTEAGDSFDTNYLIDSVLVRRMPGPCAIYANGHDLKDPYISAIFGDFSKGYPPTILMSGTRDLFLSNTVVLHRALRRAGIEADLNVFEAKPHGSFGAAPEDMEALSQQLSFIDAHLGTD